MRQGSVRKVSDYIPGHKTPRKYRNPFLTQAMAELGMIDPTFRTNVEDFYN